jgi:hypothetical protein
MKPADFFIGLFDFLAILMPGTVAVWLAARHVDAAGIDQLLRIAGKPLRGEALWAVFLLASYVAGHLVFMIASGLDRTYDAWRTREKPTDDDRTFAAAKSAYETLHPGLSKGEFTTLKWAKSYVQIRSSAARGDIERLEASQKLFRSLVVVGAASAAHFLLAERRPLWSLACVALAVVSYWRYVDQRWKMTELTYATAAILYAVSEKGERRSPPGGAGGSDAA